MLGCFLALILLALTHFGSSASGPTYVVHRTNHTHPTFKWEEVHANITDTARHLKKLRHLNLSMTGIPAEDISPYKVFVTMTTVSYRETVFDTVVSLLRGAIIPTKIYVFISEEPFMHDEGITVIPENLLTLIAMKLVHVIYTDNIGPHRKLIPLLAKHYHDPNVLMMIVDDDKTYGNPGNHFLCEMIQQFMASNQTSVVATRMRRIGLCHDPIHRYTVYESWNITNTSMPEMLVLPTGTGGVLYRPSFFHPIVFSNVLRNLTDRGDDITFRFACMVNNVSVVHATTKCPADISSLVLHKQRKASTKSPSKPSTKSIVKPSSTSKMTKGTSKASNHSRSLLSDEDEEGEIDYSIKPWEIIKHEQEFMKRSLRGAVKHKENIHLWTSNVVSGNDMQLQQAIKYLSEHNVFHFNEFIQEYHNEREDFCYTTEKYVGKSDPKSLRVKKVCSMFDCSRTVTDNDFSYPVNVNTTLD